MFALVIGITKKRCPAMPVKYEGLTQRILCTSMNYLNRRAKRRSMDNDKRDDQFQQHMTWKHTFCSRIVACLVSEVIN